MGDPCAEGHDWVLTEANLTGRGADQIHVCSRCGATAYQPGQAALRDTRPPLDRGTGATP
jgi:hypothetical protein